MKTLISTYHSMKFIRNFSRVRISGVIWSYFSIPARISSSYTVCFNIHVYMYGTFPGYQYYTAVMRMDLGYNTWIMSQYLSLQIRIQAAVLWLVQKHSWKCNASDWYSGGGVSKITRSPAVWTGILLSLLTAGKESTWITPRSFPSKSFNTAKSQAFAAVMLRYSLFGVVMHCGLVYYWQHSESAPSSY